MVALNMKNILPFPMAKLKKMRRKKNLPRTLVLRQNTLPLLWPQKLLSSPRTEHCFVKIHYCCMVVVYHHVFITNSRKKKKRINLGYSPLQLTTLFHEKQCLIYLVFFVFVFYLTGEKNVQVELYIELPLLCFYSL